jgi:hypothetical protein
MRTKKPLSIVLVALLMISMAMLTAPTIAQYPAPPNGGSIYLDPDYVNGSDVGVGNTFVVELWANMTPDAGIPPYGCYAYAYWLDWDDTLLEIQSYNVYPPTDVWTSGIFTAEDLLVDTDINTKDDRHSYSVTALGTPPGWNDTRKIGDYTFKVIYEPIFPESDVVSSLDLTDKGFADANEDPISMNVYDGVYEVFAGLPPTPKLEVKDPRDHDNEIERCEFPLDSKLNVTVCIKDLHWANYLRAWEAKLSFPTSLLNMSAAYNGTFLESFGPLGVFYVNTTFEDDGYVLIAGTMLGDPAMEPGTSPPMPFNATYNTDQGVLMTVEFLVTNVSVAPTMYEGEIGLYDTKLVNSTDLPIDHLVSANLTYYACFTTLGWYLDCTTDSFRKKCDTPYVGVGPNMTADAYEPQDLVILYATLTYNEEPEAYKMVTFEIHGPANSVENITIFRTAWTNASGIATINFTIPGSGLPNWEEMVFGKWWCYQAAQVKIYTKVTDWIFWEVGWIVEVTSVEVGVPHPEGVERGEEMNITICFKNIMMIEKPGIITITVLDELLDPIQTEVGAFVIEPAAYGPVEEFEPGLFASNPIPSEDCVVIYSTIPIYAHVGLATVYVNCFTDLPSNCGCPYCPEVTVTFWVIATGTGT